MKWCDKKIKDYWNRQAIKYGQSQSASWSDHYVIDMEIKEISKYLPFFTETKCPDFVNKETLDIGCANGYSTMKYASRPGLNIKGIDYSPDMIAEARKRFIDSGENLSSVVFEEGNILSLEEKEGFYDIIICTRVLINLGSLENQLLALNSLAKPLKKGGLLLLSEATIQGWNNLNAFRGEFGLSGIPMPPFNLYLDEDKVIEVLFDDFELWEINNFASSYYVGTRVFKPLIGENSYSRNPLTHMNRFMSQFPNIGDYGIQKLFIFSKK